LRGAGGRHLAVDRPDDLTRIGEGVQAEVFLQSDGSVLKLWRSPAAREAVDREATALRALEHRGLAPVLIDVVVLDGRPGIVMERVANAGLAAILRSRPWKVARTASALAEFHVAIHEVAAPVNLPRLSDQVGKQIRSADDLPSDLAKFALGILELLPEGDRLCHGDFHVANVLGTSEQPVAIDWPNAARGDPMGDVAHTNILHRFGRPRQGTNRLERAVIGWGRGAFGRRYLEAYQSRRPNDQCLFERWETVRAAARLSAGVRGEVQPLLRFLEQRRADGGL